HEHEAEINEAVSDFTRRYKRDELAYELQKAGIPCLPVNTPTSFMANEHVQARQLFQPVDHPHLGSYVQTAFPPIVDGTRVLAACGAEVIKIESNHGGLDNFRFFGAGDDLDRAPRFIESNLNVLSALINLKDPTGIRLTRELIARSDVVLDNFRPDVMNSLGLGPDDLRAMKPELIVARMPGLGVWGPKHWYGTWGSTLTAFSGVTH